MKHIIVAGSSSLSLKNFRLDFLLSLQAQGLKVTCLAPQDADFFEIQDFFRSCQIEILPIPISNTGMNPLKDAFTLFSFYKVFSNLKPDICFFYTIKPILYGSIAAYLAKVPQVFSMITGIGEIVVSPSKKLALLRKIIFLLYKVSLLLNRNVFFQNRDDHQFFIDQGLIREDKCIYVPGSGVNLQAFPYRGNSVPSPLSFLFMGRLLWSKGVREFIEAAKIIKPKYPYVTFKIIGGFYKNPSSLTQEQIENIKQENVIEFIGPVKEVRPYLKDASVFVLPSYREGLPRSTLEAMAIGLPIITTQAPGCKDTVKEGENGFLVPIGDAIAIAKAMEKFIQNPELIEKMGYNSRKIAEESFSVEHVNEILLSAICKNQDETI